MESKNPIIEIKNVTKSFGKKSILNNINIDIYPGERVGILGGNGAGKTTLVDMVSLTTKPTSGSILINVEGNLKKEIGIQFQEGNWPSGIAAIDMLKFYKSIYPNFNDERQKLLEEIFEIDSFKSSRLNRLSGGQKQRFNAMLAVLNKPKIVILDELTTGLDMKLQFKLIDFFKKSTIEDDQTLLIVSHMPEEVEQLCTRIIVIGDQKVLLDEKMDDLAKKKISIRKLMHEYFEKGVLNA